MFNKSFNLEQVQRKLLLTDETIDIWAKLYQLRNELRCDPRVLHLLQTPEVLIRFICAFV